MPRGVPKEPRTTTAVLNKESAAKAAPIVEEQYRTFRPRDLSRDFDGLLYVRNETNTYVSFDGGPDIGVLKLRQAGTPDSIAVLPPAVARHPGFRKFWTQGKVTVSDDPDMEIAIEQFAFDEAERSRTDQFAIQQKIYNPRTQELEWPGIGDISSNVDQ